MAVRWPTGAMVRVQRLSTPDPASTGLRTHGALRAWLVARRQQRGQALVELALVTPLLLLLFAGAGDLGRAFYGYVAIENATKEGALYGARYPLCATLGTLCPDPDNVQWRFQQEIGSNLRNADGTQLAATSTCYAPDGTARTDLRLCVVGDTYAVRTSYTFAPLTPMLSAILGGNLVVSATATAGVLNQAFDPTPGIAPTKLVHVSSSDAGLINLSEITSNCTQPDPFGSPDYYRSPCVDNADSTITHEVRFYLGSTISYKIIVRNNGGTNLTGVTVSDSQGATGCSFPTMINVNAIPSTCKYTRVAPTPSGASITTQYINDVTATSNEATPATDTVKVQSEQPPADLRITKVVSPYALGDNGDGNPNFGSLTSLTITHSAQVGLNKIGAWFWITVTNIGGQTATGVTISDSNGPLPYGTAAAGSAPTNTLACGASPSSISAGASYTCAYHLVGGAPPYTADGVYANTITVSSPSDTLTANNTATATVTVSTCTGTNLTVPNVIGTTKAAAGTAWTAAGLTGTVSSWSGSSGTTFSQSVPAFSCVPTNTGVTIAKAAANP